MKFVILTNTYNPHMKPLADSLYNRLGDNFYFICKSKIELERRNLGWTDIEDCPYLLNLSNNIQREKCENLIIESDVVYFGANPDMFSFIKPRLKLKLLTYFHSERLFKHGFFQFLIPNYFFKYLTQRIITSYQKNVFTLSASSFLKSDYLKIFAKTDNIYKIGYYPEFFKHNIEKLVKSKRSNKIRILCVGRLLKLKHFDNAIKVVNLLFKKGYHNIELNIFGNGVEKERLNKLIKSLQAENYVILRDSIPPECIRKEMDNSNIFLMLSDKREGWGVVLNEAMNSGCAVIASESAGSTKYLVNNNINGLVQNYSNLEQLQKNLILLIETDEIRERFGYNAYLTIENLWNSEVAATRLIEFSKNHFNDKKVYYDVGPLSKV